MSASRARRRRIAVLLGLLVALGCVVIWLLEPTGPRRRLLDEARIIPRDDVPRFNAYLQNIFVESDVDIRIVFVKDLGGQPIEEAAVKRMEALGIGRAGGRARGALFLYDVAGQQLRVEVGYGLEEHFPDAFVGYLMNEHARGFFGLGDVSTGLRLSLRILHERIRSAVLGDRFDPRVLTAIRRHRGELSGGAGASAPVRLGGDPSGLSRTTLDATTRTRFLPQPTPEGTYQRYLDWLALGRFDPELALFTPETTRYLATLPVTPAYFDYILLREYGKLFRIDARRDLALLYFTNDPLIEPNFFRQAAGGWRMDIVAAVRNTRNGVGGIYGWDWRGSDDDFSRAFADKLVTIRGHMRIADGDNRQLPGRWSRL